MIAAQLGLEHGFEHVDWLIFTEGEDEVESLKDGRNVEGEIYDIRTHSNWAPAAISLEEVVQPEVEIGIFEYQFNLPQNMLEISEGEISGMRAGSKSDVPSVHKVYHVRAGDYDFPKINAKDDYIRFNDDIYQEDQVPFDLPRRESYADLARYRAMTDEFKDRYGDELA